jgi:limonene-1,2-epoxide hydrolase
MAMDDEQARAQKALAEQFRYERSRKESGIAGGSRRGSMLRRVTSQIVVWGVAILTLAALGGFVVFAVSGAIETLSVADTAKHFCFAISEDDYSTAYSMLSTGARARHTQAELADVFKQVHVAACDTNEGVALFTISSGHARVAISYAAADDTGAIIGKYGGEMLLIQQDGNWQVDGCVASQGDILG